MAIHMDRLPDGYIACVWCGGGYRLDKNNLAPTSCSFCGLNPKLGEDNEIKIKGKSTPRKASKSRKGSPKIGKLSTVGVGQPVIGIDPGSRYTGVVVRDGDVVLHASTLVRPKDLQSGTDWALVVVAQIQSILKDFPVLIPIGIEGISDPKGFQHGKKAAINPKDIIRAAIVLGAVVATWPNSMIVPPGGNGSQHVSHYPASLVGRRSAELPGSSSGAGTRNHEQSAYDVAGKTAKGAYPIIIPDII